MHINSPFNDKEHQFLVSQGLSGSLNDLRVKYLRSLGHTGSLPDMLYKSTLAHPSMLGFHSVLREAASGGNSNVQWGVLGDSTRDLGDDHYLRYMDKMLRQIGVEVLDGANSGFSAADFNNDVGGTGITAFSTTVTGTGANTGIGISFGINDYGDHSGDTSLVEADILSTISTLRSSFPDITIWLEEPVPTGDSTRNVALKAMYAKIASEQSMFLVNLYDDMAAAYDGDGAQYWWDDATHPNRFMAMGMGNAIISQVIPASIRPDVGMDERFYYPASGNLSVGIATGHYNSDGSLNPLSTSLRFLPIENMLGGETLRIWHPGNREDIITFDYDGNRINREFYTPIAGTDPATDYETEVLTDTVEEVRVNIEIGSGDATMLATSEASAFVEYAPVSYPRLSTINSLFSTITLTYNEGGI